MNFGTVFGMMLQRQEVLSGLADRNPPAVATDDNWTRLIKVSRRTAPIIRKAVTDAAVRDFQARVVASVWRRN